MPKRACILLLVLLFTMAIADDDEATSKDSEVSDLSDDTKAPAVDTDSSTAEEAAADDKADATDADDESLSLVVDGKVTQTLYPKWDLIRKLDDTSPKKKCFLDVKAMPDGDEKNKAIADLFHKYVREVPGNQEDNNKNVRGINRRTGISGPNCGNNCGCEDSATDCDASNAATTCNPNYNNPTCVADGATACKSRICSSAELEDLGEWDVEQQTPAPTTYTMSTNTAQNSVNSSTGLSSTAGGASLDDYCVDSAPSPDPCATFTQGMNNWPAGLCYDEGKADDLSQKIQTGCGPCCN